ncbi:glycosyltransferase family 2 protein [Clostridium saccharoperbutylacetonicum]|uniref:glycosyltransferase family 2 protein n=1 Tax=Clostridium saccharoperbutylacetonicum TaxID=36745 RepID=UPI0039E843BC
MLKVSIIIPVYNAEKYLKESIESAVKQTMSNEEYEILVVNDGSTDKSKGIAEKFAEVHKNINVINQKNRQVCGALNTGLRNAKGKYIYILHNDDTMDQNLLKTCYELGERNNLDVVHFGYRVSVNQNNDYKNYMKGFHNKEERLFNSIPTNRVLSGMEFFKNEHFTGPMFNFFINKKFLYENNLFFDETVFIDDVEFIPRLCMKTQRIMHISKSLYTYRISEINTSQKAATKLLYYNTIQMSLYKYCNLVEKYKNDDEQLINSFKKYFWLEFGMLKSWIETMDDVDKKMIMKILYNDFIPQYIKLFGEKLEECDYLRFLNVYGNVSEDLENESKDKIYMVDDSVKVFIKEAYKKRENIIKNLVEKIPLNDKGKEIGIYGIGNHTKKFLEYYEKHFGIVKAGIKFIDTFKGRNEETFNEHTIININDINNFKFDCIIISSATYEKELYTNVIEILKNRVNVYRFYEKYDGCCFF